MLVIDINSPILGILGAEENFLLVESLTGVRPHISRMPLGT